MSRKGEDTDRWSGINDGNLSHYTRCNKCRWCCQYLHQKTKHQKVEKTQTGYHYNKRINRDQKETNDRNNNEPLRQILDWNYGFYGSIPWIQELLSYLVMDNATIHTSKDFELLVERWYCCIYLPPYSPELNPIEQFWSKAKYLIKREALIESDTLSSRIAEACNMTAWIEDLFSFSRSGLDFLFDSSHNKPSHYTICPYTSSCCRLRLILSFATSFKRQAKIYNQQSKTLPSIPPTFQRYKKEVCTNDFFIEKITKQW